MEFGRRSHFAFNSRAQTHLRIKNKVVEDAEPRSVNGQMIVELWRNLPDLKRETNMLNNPIAYFWQIRAIHKRKIVVLHVTANIESNHVNGPIVT